MLLSADDVRRASFGAGRSRRWTGLHHHTPGHGVYRTLQGVPQRTQGDSLPPVPVRRGQCRRKVSSSRPRDRLRCTTSTDGQRLLSLVRWCPSRQFLESSYKPIKKSNPSLPFLVREAAGTPARVFARFGACKPRGDRAHLSFHEHCLLTCDMDLTERGVEKHAELDGLSASEVEKKMADLLGGR